MTKDLKKLSGEVLNQYIKNPLGEGKYLNESEKTSNIMKTLKKK